jgi:hypothetical protein
MISIEQARKMGATFIKRYRISETYKSVFGSPDGELVLLDLMRRLGLFETSVVFGAEDEVLYREGRRSVALEILDLLRFDGERVLELAKRRDEAEEAG